MTAIDIAATVEKMSRPELVSALSARDGMTCQYEGCERPLDFSAPKDGPLEVTIDHWIPQYWCKDNGWTYGEIWALSNLKLMHKKCNALKGDRIPNADGTLPPRPTREFKYRRQKRATRVGLCEVCNNGHNLAADEICASCGGDPQAFPSWAKVKVNECDHEILWCWACSIGVIEREPALNTAIRHGESGEDTVGLRIDGK